MKRQQTFKYELMPTGEQQRRMRRFAGACRFVYNKALALQKARFDAGEKKLGYAGLCKQLTQWRNSTDTAWLADAPVHPLQQSLKDLERAYANFFAKRAGFPRFKKKGRSDSFRYPDPKQIKLDQANSRLFLPKLGWLRYRNSRAVLGTVKNITVSQSCGKWFVSIQTEREAEHPGKNIRVKSGVNKSILDQGWFEFRRQLAYKLAWRGGRLVVVPPMNTSRTCPCCGHVSADNRRTQARFACVECGFEENADVVGAINVLRAGHARFACEVSGAAMPPAAGTHRSDFGSAQCCALAP
jgi:transposase